MRIKGPLFILLAICVSGLFVYISSFRKTTDLENILFQVFSLGVGLFGSYAVGQDAAKKMAMEIVKPHAKSAFRRMLSLYGSLQRLAVISQSAINMDKTSEYKIVLSRIYSIIMEQIHTADDAVEDWKDIIPDEVKVLQEKSKSIAIYDGEVSNE